MNGLLTTLDIVTGIWLIFSLFALVFVKTNVELKDYPVRPHWFTYIAIAYAITRLFYKIT